MNGMFYRTKTKIRRQERLLYVYSIFRKTTIYPKLAEIMNQQNVIANLAQPRGGRGKTVELIAECVQLSTRPRYLTQHGRQHKYYHPSSLPWPRNYQGTCTVLYTPPSFCPHDTCLFFTKWAGMEIIDKWRIEELSHESLFVP